MKILRITKNIEQLFGSYELCRTQTRQIRKLRERLETSQLTVAVIGQFKRGKTTLVNRMIGKEFLPVGIVPITAAVTRISYGDDDARVIFENNLQKNIELSEISSYISEQENQNNELRVASVEIHTKSEFLKDGVVLVDTPGAGSVHEKNSLSAYEFVRESDAVIFVLSVDSPLNEIEIDFLKKVKKYAGKFYFCVNKKDIIDEKELSSYLVYCGSIIVHIMGIENVKIYPVSAKTGEGVNKLKSDIAEELSEFSGRIIDKSVRLKLLEILKNTRAQISSYRSVLNMAPNVFRRRFEEINRELSRLRREIEETDDRKILPKVKLNEEKLKLKAKVEELFGIDYYYDMEFVDTDEIILAAEYKKQAAELYDELENTLNSVFMYKEENAYAVARRIEDLNILIRNIEKYEKQVKKHE